MQVFVVVSISNPEKIEAQLKSFEEGKSFLLKAGVWIVAFDGTTQQLAEKLGIREGDSGTGLVTPISNYSGRASADLWEWFKINWPSEKVRND